MTEDAQPPLPLASSKSTPQTLPLTFISKRIRSHTDRWLDLQTHHARGERALWVAVITQAMQDAQSRCQKAESVFCKHEAIHWLTGNSKDFITVCLCADMEPDYVRRKAKQVLGSPRPWRAEAGKGKRYLERKAYRERMRAEAKQAKQDKGHLPTVINGPWASI